MAKRLALTLLELKAINTALGYWRCGDMSDVGLDVNSAEDFDLWEASISAHQKLSQKYEEEMKKKGKAIADD